MTYALLVIFQPGQAEREFDVGNGEESVTIGRALDNTICLEDDTNVSRYHAEIVKRGDTFYVMDLGSSNGTTVDDVPVEFESQLRDGNRISVGGSTVVEVHLSDAPWSQQTAVGSTAGTPPKSPTSGPPAVETAAPANVPLADASGLVQQVPVAAPVSSGSPVLLIVGGVAGGLVLTGLVAALIIGLASRGCDATVRIASPQTGATLRGPTAIRLEVDGRECIERVIYQLDGTEVARVETAPYDVILDPSRLRVSGGNHTLAVSTEDTDGRIRVEETILLSFETASVSAETSASPGVESAVNDTPAVLQDASVDVRSLTDRLAGQISRKSGYVFDRDFVDLIRVRSNEYRVGGYTDRARRYRREINKAFRDQGLDPLLGYVLAMSRSRFNDNTTAEGIGLWQIPLTVAQGQGYLTAGESQETLKDPKRSAEIAAVYTKALVSTFESTDDFMFAVACFGLPLNQAGLVRTQLATLAPDPLARRDFMKMVKLGVVKGEQVDRVVRFFAAGIVTENPRAFGLQADEPFSSMF
jgi:hypothetical protein